MTEVFWYRQINEHVLFLWRTEFDLIARCVSKPPHVEESEVQIFCIVKGLVTGEIGEVLHEWLVGFEDVLMD